MSNTVKIKNRQKKKEIKVNYKLWATIFGVFVAAIVGLAVWASFHWGVGMGTVGVRPVTPEVADLGATDAASEYATSEEVTLTPEQLKEMGISPDGAEKGAQGAGAEAAGAEKGAQGAGAEADGAEKGAQGAGAEAAGAEKGAQGAGAEAAGAEKGAQDAGAEAAGAEEEAAQPEGESAAQAGTQP